MADKDTEKRLLLLFSLILALAVIIVGRLWYLQMIKGEHYARLADGNRMRQLRVMSPRGEIRDRRGEVLVRSRASFTVSLVPGGFPKEAGKNVELLCELLGISPEELEEAVEKGRGFPYEPVRIRRNVDPETVVALEENRIHLPGVFIEKEPVREYLYGDLASHLIGHLGIINAAELREYGAGYRGSDLVGKSGIEQTYENLLRGEIGMLTVEVNALSRPLRNVNILDPIPGYNIVLTLDRRLQAVAERAFLEHIETLEENPGTQTGGILAVNPQNGEVLVMASIPSFCPERLLDVTERNTYYKELSADQKRPFFNRVTQALYGPGSAFKPVTALALLEENVISPTERFNATGISKYGVRDWVITNNQAPFGLIDMYDAVGMSSNHYFAEHGVQVGIDNLSRWMEAFGFGSPTGLQLLPGESKGLLPSREWKEKAFSDQPASERNWYPSDTEQISIGQGFHQMTLLQIAQVYQAVATKGKIYTPQIVKEILTPEGTVIYQSEPKLSKTVEAKEKNWELLRHLLTAPVKHPRGTARTSLADFPIPVAAKTGTWEIPGRLSNGVFVAFAPVEEPEILVAVIVEQGGGGASAAGPIVRRILDSYFGFEEQENEE
ncbi:MAG: penicillin-binding protein 2 [Firmicutes bacterium]|nr:penicillin-binding protein 2 [Bacillota bacterium]